MPSRAPHAAPVPAMSHPSVRKSERTSGSGAPRARSVAMSRRLSVMSMARAPAIEKAATKSTSSEMKKMPHFSAFMTAWNDACNSARVRTRKSGPAMRATLRFTASGSAPGAVRR